jgi:hypothetical protein
MARKPGKIRTFIALWQRHEQIYVSIFSEALEQLDITEELSEHEDDISEVLCPLLRQICFTRKVRIPDWEKPIQPNVNEELKGGKNRKRPDFTCSLINSFAQTQEMYEINFHIECKRLGKKKGSWNLNKNYITNGIQRFDSGKHEYGKKALSGMMIGYIIDMKPSEILDDVNNHIVDKFPRLNFSLIKKVVAYQQKIIRNTITPKEFKLIHKWVDLREFK